MVTTARTRRLGEGDSLPPSTLCPEPRLGRLLPPDFLSKYLPPNGTSGPRSTLPVKEMQGG